MKAIINIIRELNNKEYINKISLNPITNKKDAIVINAIRPKNLIKKVALKCS
jgi:hypothetical protein